MRVLVTGAAGFVGRHATRDLLTHGHTVIAFDLHPAPDPTNSIVHRTGDIRDAAGVARTIEDTRPEACLHLSGMAFVPESWERAADVLDVNLLGTVHVLEAFRATAPQARLLIVSSVEVYGQARTDRPLAETEPLLPANPYAVSKAAADQTALVYARRYGMPIMTVRPDNHIGPGQSSRFVVASFAEQLARMALGQQPSVIQVGNLDNARDFMDVRDVARAYRLLLEGGQPGAAYNLATGRPVTIRRLLDGLCEATGIRPTIAVDPARFRPTEARPLLDTRRIREDVGWQPEIALADTLRDIVAECRARMFSDSNLRRATLEYPQYPAH